jgi:hypothetical protein
MGEREESMDHPIYYRGHPFTDWCIGTHLHPPESIKGLMDHSTLSSKNIC